MMSSWMDWPALSDSIRPRHKGHNAIEAIEAIRDGRSRALVCLGGNLAGAMSDRK